jgi:amidase
MSTFITRLETSGDGVRLAVKDLIDVEGVSTTAGCRAVANAAKPALADAPCLAGARAAGARIVGKVNLHELAFGTTGLNRWFGNPANPLDASLVPGGSSSGSAVAVADGDADVAYGSDTGGSIRVPSACCGTTGLKTTWGRIPLDGVWPLAPSLDTVGPMARDVAGVVLGMQLLEPGFAAAPGAASTIGRLRLECDPAIDAAIDQVLAASELDVVEVDLAGWRAAYRAGVAILLAEAYQADRRLDRAGIGDEVAARIDSGAAVTSEQVADARQVQTEWKAELARLFERVQAFALPTIVSFPPTVEQPHDVDLTRATLSVNLGGNPALALPVPAGAIPSSLQLVGPERSEELLCATGLVLEAAAATPR